MGRPHLRVAVQALATGGRARAVQQAAGGGPMGGYPRLTWATYRRKGATKD